MAPSTNEIIIKLLVRPGVYIYLYHEEIWIEKLILEQSVYVTKNKKTNDDCKWQIQLCGYIPCKEWVKSFEIYVKFPPAIYVQQNSCNIFTAADTSIIKADDQNWTYQHGIMKNDTSCPIENKNSYLSLLLHLFLKIANGSVECPLFVTIYKCSISHTGLEHCTEPIMLKTLCSMY